MVEKAPSRGENVIAFIERYCIVPEGILLGKPVKLLPFQKKFIIDVYDNPHGTSRAYLSIARKNGKTGLIACLLLAHIVGPEAYKNSSIISGARSRDQAAQVFNYASKMIWMSPEISGNGDHRRALARVVPSNKTIIGLAKNVTYKAISAEAATAHGGSPILAIMDEVGQVKGPTDAFVEAIETSQGAYEGRAMLIAISTQAATDNDLFSRWIDDAETSKDPRIVSHVYAAPAECDVLDENAWAAANPALGVFRSFSEVEDMAKRAARQPTVETSFRWLFLNQRIDASAPLFSPATWKACNAPVESFDGLPVFGGLDLSEVSDLTALVLIAPRETDGRTIWHVKPTFWLPGDSLYERAKADRVPYDVWAAPNDNGEIFLQKTPGPTVEYEYVAAHLWAVKQQCDLRKIAFDRYNWRHLKPWLLRVGFSDADVDEKNEDALFVPFGQGYASMSPALRDLSSLVLNQRMAHGGHPVLNMCISNTVVRTDPAGNKKLDKEKARGRIDGAVALAMATAVAGVHIDAQPVVSVFELMARAAKEAEVVNEPPQKPAEPAPIAAPKTVFDAITVQSLTDEEILRDCRPGDPLWQAARARYEARLQSSWDD